MKITLLSHNLSSNAVGRAWVLGKMLEKNNEVKIIGPAYNNKIWRPLEDSNIKIEKINLGKNSISERSLNNINFLRKIIEEYSSKMAGDIIYSVKPLPKSFIPGIYSAFKNDIPLILDIDDWHFGNLKSESIIKIFGRIFADPFGKNFFSQHLLEKSSRLADCVTVSSRFLQERFGGEIIRHGRSKERLNPNKIKKERCLKKYSVDSKNIIGFIGSPRKHKGLEDLIKAIDKMKNEGNLLLAGIDTKRKYDKKIIKLAKEKLSGNLKIIEEFSFEKLPEIIQLTDIIVIPQRKTPFSMAQIPAKLFDAMAMGKPIITTKVSDMPEILGDSGIVINNGDLDSLSNAMDFLIENKNFAKKLGEKARKKFLKNYSLEKQSEILNKYIKKNAQVNTN